MTTTPRRSATSRSWRVVSVSFMSLLSAVPRRRASLERGIRADRRPPANSRLAGGGGACSRGVLVDRPTGPYDFGDMRALLTGYAVAVRRAEHDEGLVDTRVDTLQAVRVGRVAAVHLHVRVVADVREIRLGRGDGRADV